MARDSLSALVLLLVVFAASGCGAKRPDNSDVVAWREPLTGMEFRCLPAGAFRMGAPFDETGRQPDEQEREVELSRPFCLGRFEVTQAEWEEVMGSSPLQAEGCEQSDCPVVNVNWLRIEQFAERLSARTGETFRLPTEAEWEYACRAGTRGPFSTGENLTTEQANYDGRYPYAHNPPGENRDRPTSVGTFPANPWGLHDMHGNVWEWTLDDYCPYEDLSTTDPIGTCGALKVIRGGSWYFNAESARSALRYTHDPRHIGPSLGFRLVRELN